MKPKQGLVLQEIEDGMIIYDPQRDESFVLNHTASFIWNNILLSQQEMVEALAREFGLEKDQAEKDIEEFLQELVDKGLVL